MKREFNKRTSDVELEATRERVTRPISWRIDTPSIDKESGDVGVNVHYYVHNGVKGERGDEGQVEFFFDRGEFAPTLREVDKLDSILRIKEISKISNIRDEQFRQFNLVLCDAFDSNSKTDRMELYRDVESKMFNDHNCHEQFRNLIKAEALLNLLKRPKVFYSEELQSLFT